MAEQEEETKQQNNAELHGLFKPVFGDETEYCVVPHTIENYEALKKLAIQSGTISNTDKIQICREMGWDFDKIAEDKYGMREYLQKFCEIIFEGFKAKKGMNLHPPVIWRAYAYFLASTR